MNADRDDSEDAIHENEGVQVGMPYLSERPESPPASYESMKSDDDCHNSVEASEKPCSNLIVQLAKADTAEMMQSRGSEKCPTGLNKNVVCMSGPTPRKPPHPSFAAHGHQLSRVTLPSEETTMDLPFIFKSIQNALIKLFEDELIVFKRHLSIRYAEYFEGQMEYCDDVLGVVDKMLERCGKGGALKITIRILKDLKEYDLAESLEKSCKRTWLQYELRTSLKRRYNCIFEGIARQGQQTFLSCAYVDMCMTMGTKSGVNSEHEVMQTEAVTRDQGAQGIVIPCKDIFKSFGCDKQIRTVLTTGVAGIGLTVCVQRFILDWTEEKANQDIQFVFPFPFRELNLVKEEGQSLMDLICIFFPDMKEMDFIEKKDCKVLFILDGLDDCKHPLDFQQNGNVTDIREPASLDVLLTNLIRGNLLPSALVWISSRSAASRRLPPDCVHRCTVLRGFNDEQKIAYFTKKFKDPAQASRILSHVMSSRTLHIMCHIPVFCWIIAAVFEGTFTTDGTAQSRMPTQCFTHYLILQMLMKNQKYHGTRSNSCWWLVTDREFVIELARFAFQQLEKGRYVFYEEDLKQHGLDVNEVIVNSGLCTEIFKQDLCQEREFCFIHQSFQEYLAALYVHHTYVSRKRNVVDQPFANTSSKKLKVASIAELYKCAIDKALQSENGHWDLVLYFLLGLSAQSTQRALQGLLTDMESVSFHPQETIVYIQKLIRENVSPERCRNLSRCLQELESRPS